MTVPTITYTSTTQVGRRRRPLRKDKNKMPELTVNIPPGVAARVLNAVAFLNGYSATLPDGSANPQTKAQFVRAHVAQYLKNCTKTYEAEVARLTALAATDNEVTID